MLNSSRFYAPWCGHCRNLKPEYEKAAKGLRDLAQVAAVNCDEESNKAFCGSMGVQGFPTLKIVKPGKKPGKPIVEDYQGPREAKPIIEHLKSAIPNNVKRVTDKALTGWLNKGNDTAKAILFSDKGTTGALIKVLASDFLGKVSFAQIRDKEESAVEMFGVEEYPTLVILPGGTQDPVTYEGSFSRTAMKEFISQHASVEAESDKTAGQDKKQKQKPLNAKEKKSASSSSSTDAESFSSATSSQKSSQASDSAASATSEVLEEETDNPTSPSPKPAVTPSDKPIQVPVSDDKDVEPIPVLIEETFLRERCLGLKTSTCVLALLPKVEGAADATLPPSATEALASLANLAHKHSGHGTKIFPFFSVPFRNAGNALLRTSLNLNVAPGEESSKVELIAVNSRRGWWKPFEGETFDALAIETWVDNIRFGEGRKEKLPADLVEREEEDEKVEVVEEPAPTEEVEASETEGDSASETEDVKAAPPPPLPVHEEL